MHTALDRTRRPAPDAPDATAPATPTGERDVWIDAVRAASLLVVVLGHWLLAVVHLDADGGATADTLLRTSPELHPVSLALQVMGAFFLVGGAVGVRSWRRARAAALAEVGTGRGAAARTDERAAVRRAYAGWLRARAGRLVGPVLPLLALWVGLVPLLRALGLDADLARLAGQSALAPLWFLVVYLGVQAAVPAVDALTGRLGWVRATAALLAGSALVDVAARGHDVPVVGVGGFLTVWVVPVVLGVALADGQLGPREGRWLAGLGAAGVAALVGLAGYPVLMVGTLPDGGSNQNPPSLALACLVLCHVGLLVLTRPRLTAVLQRPRAARATAVAAALSMPVFLWHMSAMALAVGASLVVPAATAGLLHLEPLGLAWWLARPLWWAVLLGWTVPLVLLAARYDRLPLRPAPRTGGAAVAGCALAAAAIAVGSAQIGDPVVAGGSLVALCAAARLLGALPLGRPHRAARG